MMASRGEKSENRLAELKAEVDAQPRRNPSKVQYTSSGSIPPLRNASKRRPSASKESVHRNASKTGSAAEFDRNHLLNNPFDRDRNHILSKEDDNDAKNSPTKPREANMEQNIGMNNGNVITVGANSPNRQYATSFNPTKMKKGASGNNIMHPNANSPPGKRRNQKNNIKIVRGSLAHWNPIPQ
jgi:hypothetical protein